jgi:hypothetical protein
MRDHDRQQDDKPTNKAADKPTIIKQGNKGEQQYQWDRTRMMAVTRQEGATR